jgi:hypothetical protein
VRVIEPENQRYAQSPGTPAADPYPARTLPRTRALPQHYYALGHASADNPIAQVPGQAPTLATQADRPPRIPAPGHVTAGPYQYAARHDGFTFFRPVTANPAFRAAHTLPVRPPPGHQARASATPAPSFPAPDPRDDRHDAPRADGPPPARPRPAGS